MMQAFIQILLCLLLALVSMGCHKDVKGPVQNATFVEYQSEVGNRMVCPEGWTVADSGENWTLSPPDGQAAINVYTCTAKGSGTLTEFREMASSLDDWRKLNHGDWTEVESQNWRGYLIAFTPENKESDDPCWDLMVISTGRYYFAISIRTSKLARSLNGDFYNNCAKSFIGIE